jgi:hypothetical protein
LQAARYELDEQLCPLARLQNKVCFEFFLKFLRGLNLWEFF